MPIEIVYRFPDKASKSLNKLSFYQQMDLLKCKNTTAIAFLIPYIFDVLTIAFATLSPTEFQSSSFRSKKEQKQFSANVVMICICFEAINHYDIQH